MPKRKATDMEYVYLSKRLKRIEDEIRRKKRRVRVLSSSSDSSASSLETRDNGTATEPPDGAPAVGTAAAGSQAGASTSAAAAAAAADGIDGTDDAAALELDTEILDILGIDPMSTDNYGNEIQKDLAVRLEHSATQGLSKDNRKELLDTYLIPSNCKLLGAPILNPELKAALTQTVIKRDKAIEAKQKVLSAAMSSLGQAITLAISSKEKNTTLLRLLMDTERMLCDCLHSDTLTRRNYVISSIKNDMKEPLQNAKIDTFLFGQNFADTLRTAKAINKSGAELKVNPAPKPGSSKKFTASTAKNWKTNPPLRKLTPATKETTATSAPATATRSQRAASSRQWQSQRPNRSRR